MEQVVFCFWDFTDWRMIFRDCLFFKVLKRSYAVSPIFFIDDYFDFGDFTDGIPSLTKFTGKFAIKLRFPVVAVLVQTLQYLPAGRTKKRPASLKAGLKISKTIPKSKLRLPKSK